MKLNRALALAALAILSGCDTSTAPIADTTPVKTLPAGARILTVSGHVRDSTGNVRVAVRGHLVKPDASGNYVFTDTIVPAAARALATDTVPAAELVAPSDTAVIVVVTATKTDTLREVPLTSWSTILSPVSVVANDISVNAATGSAISGKVVEAVWWADDTIAHVLRVPNSTSSDYYSTTIYTLYNDSAYAVNGHKYFIFLRAKTAVTDTLPVAATSIRDIGAQNGALNYTDTFFHAVYRNNVSGEALVPADSNVISYKIKRTLAPADSLVLSMRPTVQNTETTSGVLYVDSSVAAADLTSYTKVSYTYIIDSATLSAYKSTGSTDTVTSGGFYGTGGDKVPLRLGTYSFKTSVWNRVDVLPTFGLSVTVKAMLGRDVIFNSIRLPVSNLRAVYYK